MREVSEDEVIEMAGNSDCPVLGKEESEEWEAAVCLKQFPQGYVLGISDKHEDLKLLFTPSREEAESGISITEHACGNSEPRLADLPDACANRTSFPKLRAGDNDP